MFQTGIGRPPVIQYRLPLWLPHNLDPGQNHGFQLAALQVAGVTPASDHGMGVSGPISGDARNTIPISAKPAKRAPAMKVAAGPSAVQSQPATTLATSSATPVIRL